MGRKQYDAGSQGGTDLLERLSAMPTSAVLLGRWVPRGRYWPKDDKSKASREAEGRWAGRSNKTSGQVKKLERYIP